MEIFVVINKSTGKQVGKGFQRKEDAKIERNRLQEKTKDGLPKESVRANASLWAFSVTKGKNHPKL